MTVENVSADTSAVTSTPAAASPAAVPAPPSWPWRRGALILAGAAQLITISALNSADPLAVTWPALLLAIAPAPLAAAAAFAPAPEPAGGGRRGGRPARGYRGRDFAYWAVFVPALVVLSAGAVKLWREQS